MHEDNCSIEACIKITSVTFSGVESDASGRVEGLF